MNTELHAYYLNQAREATYATPAFRHRVEWAHRVAADRRRLPRQPRVVWAGSATPSPERPMPVSYW